MVRQGQGRQRIFQVQSAAEINHVVVGVHLKREGHYVHTPDKSGVVVVVTGQFDDVRTDVIK